MDGLTLQAPTNRDAIDACLELAKEYDGAARFLKERFQKQRPASRAPACLSALSAVECYLDAYLIAHGLQPAVVKELGHNLTQRSILAIAAELKLSKRTQAHLNTLNTSRDDLISGADKNCFAALSEVNKLFVTLDEIAQKVTAEFASLAQAS